MTLFDFLFHTCELPWLLLPATANAVLIALHDHGLRRRRLRQQLDSAPPVSGGGLFVPFSSLPGFSGRTWSGSEFEPVRLDSRTGMLHGAREREFLFFTLFFYIYALKNLQANCLCSIQSISFQLLNSTVIFLFFYFNKLKVI